MTDSETTAIEGAPPQRGMSMSTMGMVLTLSSIACFFAALIVAYAFILPPGKPATSISMPWVFWLSTLLMLASSGTFQWARRALLRAQLPSYRTWLAITIAVGYCFLAAQTAGAWLLLARGVAIAANPQGNMYYVFSFVHAAHLIGGIGGLHWLYSKAQHLTDGEEQPLRKHRQIARLTAMYWHFMGVLWLALFAFLLGWS
ncbi:MAG: cytochrome c oxidase subunit 3 [Acidobacteria bacterium]|nr:cytochrome c oxidase subunit 3 [Acidobacteriota bacterium]